MSVIITFVTWLIGSELGRKVALTVLAMLALGAVVWRIYSAGQAAEKAKQARQQLDAMRDRLKVDEEISKMPSAERRKKLEEWAR